MSSAAEWYYQREGQRAGPVTIEELKQMLRAGQIPRDELVWGAGMADWLPASQVDKLRESSYLNPGQVGAAVAQPIGSGMTAGPAGQAAPYARPGTLNYSMPQMDALMVTPSAMDSLRRTKPWARLIAVLIFIAAALMILGGVALIALGGMAGTRGRAMAGGPPAVLGMVYIALSLLYIAPAVYLNRYASRIGELMTLRRADVLEAALQAQKSFWKFCGVVALIVIVIYILVFVGLILATTMR